ncbi:hypothetical protein VTJ83DRAFT_6269 [Remersonia thermophila]|uniref:C2H2-type domain-containing protein n=1 Tax=Remersonia thermophila TaxID=72144 RepID=A0ABR4D6I0_9PEZI
MALSLMHETRRVTLMISLVSRATYELGSLHSFSPPHLWRKQKTSSLPSFFFSFPFPLSPCCRGTFPGVHSKMALRQLPVLSLDLAGNSADYDFDFLLSAGGTSSWCPPLRMPLSGCATPGIPGSIDFNSSFSSSTNDSFTFAQLTPSSSRSFQFPVSPTTPVSEGLVEIGCSPLSGTPTRGIPEAHGLPSFDGGDFADAVQAASSRDYAVASDFAMHPLLSGPSAPTPFGLSSTNMAHWAYPESPIQFELPSPARSVPIGQRRKHELGNDDAMPPTPSTSSSHDEPFTPSPPSTPVSAASKRARMMHQARHRTTALQHHLRQDASSGLERRSKKEHCQKLDPEGDIMVERSASNNCEVVGCGKVFRRKEHLKRHLKSAHTNTSWGCEFCGHRFNRFDNYVNHIRLHTREPRPGEKEARVKHFPEAKALLERILRNQRKRPKRCPASP